MRFTLTADDLAVAPIERAETISSSWYTSDEMLALEHEFVFARSWQFVGRVSELREIGKRIVARIGEESIVIIRGKDSVIRAFYNVCRHRGGPIAIASECASMLQCKYHGWAYTLEGSLRGVPDFDRVELFDKSDFSLVPIRLEIWDEFLFANLDYNAPPLAETVQGISERIAPIRISELRFHSRVEYEVNCNWKTYNDNYLEGYHVPLVHPELFKIYDFNRYITEIYSKYSLQHSPLSGEENIYSSGIGEAFYYFIYPNLMLNILPGRLQTNLVIPISAEKCLIQFDYFYAEGTDPKKISADLTFSDEVQREDIEICELVQRGLRSRSYDKGRFSVKREEGVYHFQKLLKEALRAAL